MCIISIKYFSILNISYAIGEFLNLQANTTIPFLAVDFIRFGDDNACYVEVVKLWTEYIVSQCSGCVLKQADKGCDLQEVIVSSV